MLLVAIEPGVDAATTVLVPAQNPEPPPGKGPEFGKASPVALVVILLLAVATALLIRGMTKRIKRLPASFDPAEPDEAEDQAQDQARDQARGTSAGSAEDAEPNRP